MRGLIVAALSGVMFVLGCEAGSEPFSTSDGGPSSTTDVASGPRDVQPIAYDAVGPTLTPDSSCAMQTSDTQRAPMNLLIVLDRSGSMGDGDKWTAAVNGINALLMRLDDTARVGLEVFPSVTGDASSEATYRSPIVPVAPLAMTRTLIRNALSNGPTGDTPMACAMPGAIGYYQDTFRLDGSRNIILITDGAPTDECSGAMCPPPNPFDVFDVIRYEQCVAQAASIRISASVAGAGRATPPIRTFVAGTADADNRFLSSVAINGNTRRMAGCETSSTCHYSLGATTFATDLNAALDEIRGRAATCEYRIMIDTRTADPGLVNVNFTPAGGASSIIPRDRTHMNGWDYSPDMRSILLYGPSCDRVQQDTTGGRVQILFGCPTIG
jgi:hypothetical protein